MEWNELANAGVIGAGILGVGIATAFPDIPLSVVEKFYEERGKFYKERGKAKAGLRDIRRIMRERYDDELTSQISRGLSESRAELGDEVRGLRPILRERGIPAEIEKEIISYLPNSLERTRDKIRERTMGFGRF